MTTKTWTMYIGRVYKMCQKIGNIQIEYKKPTIDMLTHPLHTKTT